MVLLPGENALIGGTVPEARNIISGNGNLGNIALGHNNSGSAATVQGNYIGTDVTGTRALGGVSCGSQYRQQQQRNWWPGCWCAKRRFGKFGRHSNRRFASGSAVGNVIQGNFIGLNATGTGPLPNTLQGIAISAVNNTIGGTQSEAANKIAFNGGAGVTLSLGQGNAIRSNSIFSNGGLE